MSVNKASLIKVEGDQLLDTTIVISLAILKSSAGVNKMPKMLGLEVRVVVPKVVAIKAVVVALLKVICRPMVGLMPWIPISNRGIRCISLKGINQSHLVIILIKLMRLTQKNQFKH